MTGGSDNLSATSKQRSCSISCGFYGVFLPFELAVCHHTKQSAMLKEIIAGLCEAIRAKQPNLATH